MSIRSRDAIYNDSGFATAARKRTSSRPYNFTRRVLGYSGYSYFYIDGLFASLADKNSNSFYAPLQYAFWKYDPHGIHPHQNARVKRTLWIDIRLKLFTNTVSSFRHVRIFRHVSSVTDKQPRRLEPKSLAYLPLTDSFIALAQPLPSSMMNEVNSRQFLLSTRASNKQRQRKHKQGVRLWRRVSN